MKCKMQAVQISLLEWQHTHHNFSGRLLPSSPPPPSSLFLQAASVVGSSSSSARPLVIHPWSSPCTTQSRIINPRPRSCSSTRRKITTTASPYSSSLSSAPCYKNSSNIESATSLREDSRVTDDGELVEADVAAAEGETEDGDSEGVEIEIEKIGKNSRRIRSKIAINASLFTIWSILTDYERLAEFIPGLAVSQLLEKSDNFARLFQIGQQELAFGINFNAKGIVDCYEKELEILSFGQRRDIDFKMIEGDFQLFEGKWSIEQYNMEQCEDSDLLGGQEFYTTLSYVVNVQPKLWLPVRLLEGRLGREIKMNLSCIRVEAEKGNTRLPIIN